MPNPFFFAGKITDPRHFVGREKELKRIFGYLDTSHTGQIQHASVVGERRIGKSSLLYHICQVYEKYLPEHHKYRFVYIDLDNPHCHTQAGLFTHILEKLGLQIPEPLSLEAFYDSIEAQNKDDMWAVLLMDEFEHLSQRTDEFPDNFYDALRSLGNNNFAGIVTASQHTLQSLAAEEKLTSPFFNIFNQVHLGEFTQVDANALLNRGRVCDQPFSDEDCQEILKIAGKHPACLQVVAGKVYEAKASGIFLDWKIIKAESLKEAPFANHVATTEKKKNWLIKAGNWLFVTLPQIVGKAFLQFIGREKIADTTAWVWGAIWLLAAIGLLLGFLPWNTITKYVREILGLIFK